MTTRQWEDQKANMASGLCKFAKSHARPVHGKLCDNCRSRRSLRRTDRPYRCTVCNTYGHNRRTCRKAKS